MSSTPRPDILRSTALRVALAYALSFALATLVIGSALYAGAQHTIRLGFDERLTAEMDALLIEYREGGAREVVEAIEDRETGRATNGLGYGLYAADGRRIAGSLRIPRPALGWSDAVVDDGGAGDPARVLARDVGGQRLVVAADTDEMERFERQSLGLLIGALVAMLMIGSLGAILLGTYMRRRLETIAAGAEAIVAGDMARRIPIGPRGDEFDRLGAVLNAMLDRIAVLLDNLRQVSSDLAHDLRSPLTRLRNQLEDARDRGGGMVAVERAIEQADQILALFTALLRLSEIEAGKLRQAFVPVDLAALVEDLGDSYAPVVEDGGRQLVIRVEPTGQLRGDRELLAQALINLLDNAQIHTPAGTTITLSVERIEGAARIVVADDGPGVRAEDRARIVQRFIRLEPSRHLPGHGLGLSLVSAIATIHDGALSLDDNRPGLVVCLALPVEGKDGVK